MHPDPFALALYSGAVLLGILCFGLFLLALRRVFDRHEAAVAEMVGRYDERLADFAQTLSDALNQTLPARILEAISGAPSALEAPGEGPDTSGVMRVLELAREQTSSDAAVAVAGTASTPILATVGLSQEEAARVGGLGVPDYRGARAIQMSFAGEDGPAGKSPIRSGLVVPLLDSASEPGMLAVLSRQPDRRFSELDIASLENVLSLTRMSLESSLEVREPDPVPELDPLTRLYDRPAFHALLDREIARARRRGHALGLLILDVDRLTTLNARIGHLAADEILAKLATVLTDIAGPADLACRVGGGRFAVIVGQGDSHVAEDLYGRFQAALRERPLPKIGVLTVSGGVAELLAADDAVALLVRADAALSLAKSSGRDTVVTTARREVA